jgi:hypothetical protein
VKYTQFKCDRCGRRLKRKENGRPHYVTAKIPVADQPKRRHYCWPGEGCARWA